MMSSDPTERIHERYRLYMEAYPERRCWKCAKDLNRHTIAEFQHCEFLLATSGQEAMVMNRPETEEKCQTEESRRCGYCNKPITLSIGGTGYVHTGTGLTACVVGHLSDPLSPSATPKW